MSGIELPAEASNHDRPNVLPFASGSARSEYRAAIRDFLWLSRRRWQTADAASSTFRNAMRRDQRFAAGMGNQWEVEDREARGDEGRPCIEINRIPQFIRQVSNQNRANRSAIEVHARSNGASLDTATALQAVIRSIEVESDADVVYDTATQHQLVSGLGFSRLVAQWAHDEAFEQVCRLRRVRNPLAVYWDPTTQEADFSDARWFHIIGILGQDEYESRWGKVSPYASLTEFMGGDRLVQDWLPEGRVIVAEYFYVEVKEQELLRMDTGKNVWATELEQYRQLYQFGHPMDPVPQPVRSKVVQKRTPFWCLHNAIDILEGNATKTAGRQLPGTRIPIFPTIGDELDMDGEIDYRGMVRDAMHPQQMYNFWSSSIAEAVALAPKAPWIAAKGQVEQYLDDWKNANRQAKAVLLYDPKAVGDQLVPPPTRITVEPAIQAMVAGLSEANQDLMSVMGLFEPSLGQRGGHSESGKAREALQQQGVIANSNFLDNLQRTKRAIGRSLLEWIPVIYDVPHLMHLIQPDGQKKQAVVYAGQENKPTDGEFGDVSDLFDVGMGTYDVSVSTGPSFQDQRQATQAWLLDLFKVMPQLGAIGADILLENADDPAAKQLGKRAKKALPPQFQDENDPEAELPKLQAKVQQLTQLQDLAHKAIASMAAALQGKELDNDTKKQVEMIRQDANMAIAAIRYGSAQDQQVFDQEFQRFTQRVDHLHEMVMARAGADEAASSQAREAANAVTQIGAQADASQQQIGVQHQADTALASHQAAIAPPPAPDKASA